MKFNQADFPGASCVATIIFKVYLGLFSDFDRVHAFPEIKCKSLSPLVIIEPEIIFDGAWNSLSVYLLMES
jgi:hypothetical protein